MAAQQGAASAIGNGRYVLAQASSGLCLEGSGSNTSGSVVTANCSGSTAQSFDVSANADGSLRLANVATGLSLDLAAMSTAEGASIQLWSANDTTAQRFKLQNSQGYLFSLVNSGSGKCVAIQGNALQQMSCHTQPEQLLLVYPQSTVPGAARGLVPVGQYSFRSALSGLCMDIAGGSTANGALAVQNACSTASTQRYELTPAVDGSYLLENIGSGKLLDVSGAKTDSGVPIDLWPDDAGSNQHFVPVLSGGAVLWKSVNSGKCIDVTAQSLAAGAVLQQWDCGTSKPNQQWQLMDDSGNVVVPTPPPVASGGGSAGGAGAGGGSGGGTSPGPSSGVNAGPTSALALPLELLGDGMPSVPVIATANLTLDAAGAGSATQIWFKCHRCGFFGPPEFEATSLPPTRIKGSLRVLGGVAPANAAAIAWTDITDATMTLADPERVQGGLNRGGAYTVRISFALDAPTRARLVAGVNFVQFRFNGTDGESNGYRIVALQLRNAQGQSLATNPVQMADIGAEKIAGKVLTPDATAGQAFWYAQNSLLKSTLTGRPIKAACTSCHAPDGRDLQYFNYSNNAIVQRSRFHGLTEAQGRQIAAFLRYSQQNVPHVAQAAPWNPPYQPGPGLDSKPIAEWAAGAGLDAVLDSPADAVKALFGAPRDGSALALTQADVDRVMDANATLNAREVSMPIQFADWNSYLPTMHPMDIWPAGGNAAGSFEGGATFANGHSDPLGTAKKIAAWFDSHRNPNGVYGDWSHLTPAQRDEIQSMIRPYGFEVYSFLGGGRGNHIASSGQYGAQVGAANLQKLASAGNTAREPAAFTTNAFIERSVGAMLQWNLVQQWTWAQRFGLEGNQQWFIGDYDATTQTWKGRGEARGWPFNTVSAFYLAPHMVYQSDQDASGKITRQWILAWETANTAGSYYRTNAWYQAQVTINPGAQGDWVNYSVDWPYLTGFDQLLSDTVGSSTTANANASFLSDIRLLQAGIKSAQYVDNSIPLYVASDTGSLVNNRGRFSRAQAMKHLDPTNFMATDTTQYSTGTRYAKLDQLQPGLYLKVLNGALRQFNQLYAATDPAAWRRCDPTNTDLGGPEPYAGFAFCLDRSKHPLALLSPGVYGMNSVNFLVTSEQKLQYSAWKAGQIGADPARVSALNAWVERAWP
jgi:hypothetical protein